MQFSTQCKFWRGDKPCHENRLCEGCRAFQPLGPRILIIKMGARGDVLRTTPLIAGLRKHYPQAHITWISSPESMELLRQLPGLDQTLDYSWQRVAELQARVFEWVICLDKEPAATSLAESVQAARKAGWGMAPDGSGTPRAFNSEAEYSLALGVWDELKFRKNQKSYMQIIFAAVGLNYQGEPYAFELTPQDCSNSEAYFRAHQLTPGRVVGLVTGCGPNFLRKRWTEAGFAQLAERIQTTLNVPVVLLGGPDEQAINQRIRSLAKVSLLDTEGKHSLRELAGFIAACGLVVTGDTLALHLAIALGRKVVALFGPTCSQEIDLFGRGEKISAQLACSPCYRRTCSENPTCMEALATDRVWQAVQAVWERVT